jgi:hypothetical protein
MAMQLGFGLSLRQQRWDSIQDLLYLLLSRANVVQWSESFKMGVKDQIAAPFIMVARDRPLLFIILKDGGCMLERNCGGFR